METERENVHTARTLKGNIRHSVIRDSFLPDEVTGYKQPLIRLYEQ
jgi:hypothetical protein